MRKFLLGVLLLPALAVAEPVEVNTKVLCDKATDMIPYFGEKYKELPIWLGDGDEAGSKLTILANQETQTWTLITFSVEKNVACLVGTGKGFKFRLPGDPT